MLVQKVFKGYIFFQRQTWKPESSEEMDFEDYLNNSGDEEPYSGHGVPGEPEEPSSCRFLNVSKDEIDDLARNSSDGNLKHQKHQTLQSTKWAVKIFEGILMVLR